MGVHKPLRTMLHSLTKCCNNALVVNSSSVKINIWVDCLRWKSYMICKDTGPINNNNNNDNNNNNNDDSSTFSRSNSQHC